MQDKTYMTTLSENNPCLYFLDIFIAQERNAFIYFARHMYGLPSSLFARVVASSSAYDRLQYWLPWCARAGRYLDDFFHGKVKEFLCLRWVEMSQVRIVVQKGIRGGVLAIPSCIFLQCTDDHRMRIYFRVKAFHMTTESVLCG
jgi:hypothetical protein